jgi:hypothetical protein
MLTAYITSAMKEAVSISETSLSSFRATRRNIQEDGHLCIRRRKNPKSHLHLNQYQNDRNGSIPCGNASALNFRSRSSPK